MKQSLFGTGSGRVVLSTVLGIVVALGAQFSAQAQYIISNTWSIATGERSYVTSGNTERGIAYNPFTGHALLVSRAGGLRVVILDGETGAELGLMDVSGISGGTFALSQIAVADDGAIYAANLSTSTTAPNLRIYRWENESATPTLVYSADPANGVGNTRWGENLDVRGSGIETEIVVANNTASPAPPLAAIIKPTDDTLLTWTATTISNITGIAAQDMAKGVTFGTNNTFFAKNSGQSAVRLIQYDLTTGTGAVIATRTVSVANTVGIAYDIPTGLLSAVQTANNATAGNHNLLVYNATSGGALPLVGSIPFPTPYTANPNLVGDTDIVSNNIVAVDTQNGVVAAKIIFDPLPRFAADPADLTIVQGGYASLTADANGVPPLRYQWFHNSNPLPNETNRILNFTNITLEQAGDYTVAVSNDFGGAVSGPGTITVEPTVLSSAMTLMWQLPPGSRPYINTDNSQRGLAYNRANNHVLLVSRTGSNGIHVLHGDTGAHLWSMNTDPTIVTGGTFALNLVEVTDDGVVYAGNLTQDGNFKLYKWADDSETSVPELVWGPGSPAGLGGSGPGARWGDAMDLRGTTLPQLVLTSRNSNYVSIIDLWDVQLTPKVAHLDTLGAGVLGLGVAFGADPPSGGFTIWGTAFDAALRQIELTETSPNVLDDTVIREFTGFLPMVNIGVEANSNLLAGIFSQLPDNVRLVDIINAPANDIDIIDTEFFSTDNANGNGTGNVAFGPSRIYALDSNNGIAAWSYSYTRPTCVPGNLTITRISATEVQISWSQTGQRLESTSDLSATPTWNTVSSSSPATVTIGSGNRFFRLACP